MEKEILQKCSVCEQVDCFCAHGGHSRNSCRDICEWGGGQTAEETTKAFIGKRQKALVSNKLSNNLQLYTSSLYACSEANGEMKTWKFWAPKWILHQWPLCLTLQTHSTATDWLSLQKRSPTQSVQLPCQVGQQPYRPSFFIRPKNPFHITEKGSHLGWKEDVCYMELPQCPKLQRKWTFNDGAFSAIRAFLWLWKKQL